MSRPRIGFLGTGWIGRHRMEAIVAADLVTVAGIADPAPDNAAAARALAPEAAIADGLDGLLRLGLDGIVIATPSALHAGQAIAALESGTAVFCQKPLGRTAAETRAVVEAARRADRLLAVDLSYRFTEPMRRIREIVQAGELGRIFAIDLVFHNAYGPDKPWFYDRALSGGGCVMDLGIHLVDLGLWLLGFPAVEQVGSSLFAAGERLPPGAAAVEDYGTATLALATGAILRLACSWRLQAGQDAVISASLHGTGGGAALRNLDGSFYDFVGERYRGTARETLCGPPDPWGGRAAVDWAERLVAGGRCDPEADRLVNVAEAVDAIYAGQLPTPQPPSRVRPATV